MRRVAALVIGVSILLAGCAETPDNSYPSETVSTLQEGVLAVTDASASGDPVAALARLDELQSSLLDALAKGTVVQSRFDSISAAIDLVRADLELAISEQAAIDSTNTKNSDKPAKPDKPDKNDKNDKKD